MFKSRTAEYRKYNNIKGDTINIIIIILMKKEYLCELIEECLHNMEKECDLVGDEERVKKLEKSKEM